MNRLLYWTWFDIVSFVRFNESWGNECHSLHCDRVWKWTTREMHEMVVWTLWWTQFSHTFIGKVETNLYVNSLRQTCSEKCENMLAENSDAFQHPQKAYVFRCGLLTLMITMRKCTALHAWLLSAGNSLITFLWTQGDTENLVMRHSKFSKDVYMRRNMAGLTSAVYSDMNYELLIPKWRLRYGGGYLKE